MDIDIKSEVSGGMLVKKWVVENGKRYLIKANLSPVTYEYFSEAYSSYLAETIGLDTVRYEIVNADLYS